MCHVRVVSLGAVALGWLRLCALLRAELKIRKKPFLSSQTPPLSFLSAPDREEDEFHMVFYPSEPPALKKPKIGVLGLIMLCPLPPAARFSVSGSLLLVGEEETCEPAGLPRCMVPALGVSLLLGEFLQPKRDKNLPCKMLQWLLGNGVKHKSWLLKSSSHLFLKYLLFIFIFWIQND